MITLFKCSGKGDYNGCLNALNLGIDPNIKFDISWIPSDLKCEYVVGERVYDKCLNAVNLGVDPYTTYFGGWSPLHIAIENGHEECAKLLLDRGAALNAIDDDGWHPLHKAIKHGHEKCARLLLDLGVSSNIKNIKYGTTSLHMAVYYGQVSCIKLLFQYKADLYIENNGGRTAKDETENPEIIKLLEQYEYSITKPAKKIN